MDIMELTGRTVHISRASITCINEETGKTAGVVRGVIRYTDAPMRDQAPLFGLVRKSGLWGSGQMDRVVIAGKKLVYLDNQRPTYDAALDEKRRKLAGDARAAGVTVIPCVVK